MVIKNLFSDFSCRLWCLDMELIECKTMPCNSVDIIKPNNNLFLNKKKFFLKNKLFPTILDGL